jgi:oligopeptidase B
VLGGFDAARYATERIFLPARDGAEVPVSLLYRKGFQPDGKAPLLLEAYGSYGYSSDPYFDSDVLSLVDRGFVYAIAHVRGGQEMGRHWYEDGKLLRKKNTFFDFIDVTEGLVARQYAAPRRVFALGGSAGGLLMGAIATMRPDLYRGVIAAVPFVDVITTMLDESIPLTSNEFDEWGDPKVREALRLHACPTPPTTRCGRRATRTCSSPPASGTPRCSTTSPRNGWRSCARTRPTRNWLLLKTNMEAGHGGKSGRFERLEGHRARLRLHARARRNPRVGLWLPQPPLSQPPRRLAGQLDEITRMVRFEPALLAPGGKRLALDDRHCRSTTS